MKRTWMAMLGLGACLGISARAEDMTTLAGQTYSNIVVQRYDRDGLFIRHGGGVDKVFFRDIAPELRGHYKRMALNLSPDRIEPAAPEEPAGPNDLVTVSGRIYRNVVVKRCDEFTFRIIHDNGVDTLYFSEVPEALRTKFRPGMATVPDDPVGAGDLVTTYGQVFRRTEVLREEPDGLTIRHAGGVTKVPFLWLPAEIQTKYNFDRKAAAKYLEDLEAERVLAQNLAQAPVAESVPATIAVENLSTEVLPGDVFRVAFSIRNLTDAPQSVRAVPCDGELRALLGGNPMDLPPRFSGRLLQVEVPSIRPHVLQVSCGAYQTNCVLSW